MKRQRGEGKIGCILTLLVFGSLVGVGLKVVPVIWNNSELADACKFIATGASRIPKELVDKQVRDKARELGMVEVLSDKNSITVTKTGSGDVGYCNIRLRYKQVLDFYGLYKYELLTDKTISQPIMEGIS